MRISEVLNQAADYIEAFGWKQGGGWTSVIGEPTCAEGALGLVCEVTVEGLELKQAAKNAVQEYLNLSTTPAKLPARFLWVWNDSYAEDAAEVIEVLRATAVIEAARESDMAADLIALMASPA